MYKFRIEKNRANQRLLIVDKYFQFGNYESVNYADFDAVLYTSAYPRQVEEQFVQLNPITVEAFRAKPFFFHPAIDTRLLCGVCDGLYETINDIGLINEIQRIQNRIETLGISFSYNYEDKWQPERIVVGILRHYLSRNDRLPSPILRNGSIMGYAYPLSEILIKHGIIDIKLFLPIIVELTEKYKYVEPDKLLSIVHLDPNCLHSHIIYAESCPSCGSNNIQEESMIHHFRCANVSPESTYMNGGKLVCPKCSRIVRHIGVDYDRPLGIYSCKDCQRSFSQPSMTCICVKCGNRTTPDKLYPYKFYEAKFSSYGKRMLSHADVYVNEEKVAIYPNALSFSVFTKFVKNRIVLYCEAPKKFTPIRVVRIKGVKEYDEINHLVIEIMKNWPGSVISVYENTIYVLSYEISEHELDASINRIVLDFGQLEASEIDYIRYRRGMNIDQYFEALRTLPVGFDNK